MVCLITNLYLKNKKNSTWKYKNFSGMDGECKVISHLNSHKSECVKK